MSSAIKHLPEPSRHVSGKWNRKKRKHEATRVLPLKSNQKRQFWKLALGDSHTLLRKRSTITDRLEVGSTIRILCGRNRELIRRVVRIKVYDKNDLKEKYQLDEDLYEDGSKEMADQIKDHMLSSEQAHRKDLKAQSEGLRTSSARLPMIKNMNAGYNSNALVVIEFDQEREEPDMPEVSAEWEFPPGYFSPAQEQEEGS